MGQAFPRPTRIGPSVFLGDPCHRFIFPPLQKAAILPITEKIEIVFWMIFGGVNELLEISVSNRVLVDVERSHMHGMLMKAAWRVFPRILHIHPSVIEPFNFDPRDFKK